MELPFRRSVVLGSSKLNSDTMNESLEKWKNQLQELVNRYGQSNTSKKLEENISLAEKLETIGKKKNQKDQN